MKPNQAIKELSSMIDDRDKVTTKRLRKIITVLSSHLKMLETDNRMISRRFKNQSIENGQLKAKNHREGLADEQEVYRKALEILVHHVRNSNEVDKLLKQIEISQVLGESE